MKKTLNIEFAHDSDSDLYMISSESNADQWRVTVYCGNGKEYNPMITKFTAYPGCETHEGKAAWLVDYYKPEKIEIKLPSSEIVIIRHPDTNK